MSKIAFLAICLVLMVCMLTACRRNTAAETSAPAASQGATTSPTTSTKPSTRNTESTVMPTIDLIPDGSESGNATDGDGIIDDGMFNNRKHSRMHPFPPRG